MKAHLWSLSAQDRDLKDDMRNGQHELCGRTESHSGICSGSRHLNCQLCGLGKVWCPHEPWVSQDNQRVLEVWG